MAHFDLAPLTFDLKFTFPVLRVTFPEFICHPSPVIRHSC